MHEPTEQKALVINANYELFVVALVVLSLVNWVLILFIRPALEPDYVVLGGGNAKFLKELPVNCRLGANANAFIGGFRIWIDDLARQLS